MGKLLAAVLVAFLPQAAAAGMERSEWKDPVITISPAIPVQGGTMTISYTGKPGTRLLVSWDGGPPSEVEIGENGTASVAVPATAKSVTITDPDGGADYVSSTIAPA